MSVIVSNPADQKVIRDAMQEISNAKSRITAERKLIKEIVVDLSDKFNDLISKKEFNRMAKTYHADSLSEEIDSMESFEVLYRNVMGIQGTD